ncbi:MAG: nucleotidyltransferase domain-containing protein [Tannerella sp.]|jgi:predicted nucleotidyltransferase|nr:nucleotidyltransferase domain-containing protein [Tannerella sp.]
MNQEILEKITALKRQIIPNDRLILFGSQARGDAREDSDWDLLMVLDKEKITYDDSNDYAYPFYLLGIDYNTYLSVKLYSNKEWERKRITPFYKNVNRDGIFIN